MVLAERVSVLDHPLGLWLTGPPMELLGAHNCQDGADGTVDAGERIGEGAVGASQERNGEAFCLLQFLFCEHFGGQEMSSSQV